MSEPPTPRLTRAQINATKIITLPPPSLPLPTFTSISEEIAKYIINKLISLSITSHFISKVEDKLGDHCFTYTKQSINTYITSQYICYDKDEVKPKQDEHSSSSQHNQHNAIPSDLALITKHIPPIQKYESQHTIIPAMKFDLTNTFFNNYYHGENSWSIMNEPSTNEVDRYASAMIIYNKATNNVNDDNTNNNNNDNDMKYQNDMKTAMKVSNAVVKKKDDEQVKKKKKKGLMEIMNEMSCHDIAWEENEEQIKYDNEFEELRKEKEMELVRLELEKKVKVKEEQEVQIKIKQEVSKRNEYKNKKITIDANGKVVIIKPFKLDILAKDFIAIRSNTKIIKKKLPSQSQQQPLINDDNREHTIRNKKKLPSIETNNPPLSPHNVNVSSTLERKIERGPVIPSGSCFDKINPEIGVTITEDKKHKTGGKDFFKKFNKYSLENYNRQLRDTISSNLTYINNNFAFTQSNLMMHSDLNNNNALLTDINNNYNTISTFNKKNPLFKTNNFFGSSFTTNQMQRSMNQSVYEPQIKMNASNQSNLKGTLDYLNLISEKEEKMLNNKGLNRTNIFKERKLLTDSANDVYSDNTVSNSKGKLNDMTKFATGLISGDNWGNSLTKGNAKANYGRKAYKPHMKEIEKELGMTTLNNSKRLPRMRGMMYKTMQK